MPGSIAASLQSLTPDTNACTQAEDNLHAAVMAALAFSAQAILIASKRADKWLPVLFSRGLRRVLFFRLRCMMRHHSECSRAILYALLQLTSPPNQMAAISSSYTTLWQSITSAS